MNKLERVIVFFKKHWFSFFVVAVYIFFSAYYMGPGFTKCTDSIYGFGDSTAGPIWRNSLKPEQPMFGGFETNTNYPYGENLYSPVGFAAAIQTVSMNVSSKLVGPVCAYNLYNIVGYLSTALAMYAFILYLTKRRWIALLAGYAVAFTPYVQAKIGGHPNYAFTGILIAILWLLLHTLVYQKRWTAILLGIALAVCAYLDPYFILLAATIVIPVFVVWLLYKLLRHRDDKTGDSIKQIKVSLKSLAITTIVFAVLLAPLVYIRVANSDAIVNTVSKSRGNGGNVKEAATQCAITPIDYLLPDPTNIHMVKLLGANYTEKNIAHRHWCGSGESRVSISLTLLLLTVLACLFVTWERLNRYKSSSSKDPPYNTRLLIPAILSVGILGFLIALPPLIQDVIMPSGLILELTDMWRIFSREYLVINMVFVIGASLAFAYLWRSLESAKRVWAAILLFVGVTIGIIGEYQINVPFEPMTFSYSRDIPQVYRDIQSNPSINSIAEYPMDKIGIEFDSVVYYMTMQAVHGKKLFNSVLATDSRETTHLSLRDLSDPQTIPALRYLGINAIVVHGEDIKDLNAKLGDNLKYMNTSVPYPFALTMVRYDDNRSINLFLIKDGVEMSNILTIEKGYVTNLPLIQSPIGIEYEMLNNAELKETSLKNSKRINQVACFDVKMSAVNDMANLSIYKNDQLQDTIPVTDKYTTVKISLSTNDYIKLSNDKGYNMRLNNLNGECANG